MIEAMAIKFNGSFYQLLERTEGCNGCNPCCFDRGNCPKIEDGKVPLCLAKGFEGYFEEVK